MKESVVLLIAALLAVLCSAMLPVAAWAMPSPPQSPDVSWQPPDDGDSVDPQVGVEIYSSPAQGLQIPPPSTAPYGVNATITSAYLVNSYGQIVSTLYRGELCYLILSVNGPGYFYLWEYYPTGSPYGHWLCYKWYRPSAGVWKIGPFVAQANDPEGQYTWKMWFLSGPYWSTRSLSFNYTRSYSPYVLPPGQTVTMPTPVPVQTPQPVYQPAVVNNFTATPASIDYSSSATLTWTTTNATGVSISPNIGSVGVSGSTMVTPAATTTYTLTATGRAGNPATSTVTVTVSPRVAPTLNADLNSIRKGQTVTLSWSAQGAVQASLTGAGNVGASGTRQVTPEATSTYTLTAAYADGSSQQAAVTIQVEQPPLLLFGLIVLLALAAIIIVALLVSRSKRSAQPAIPGHAEAVTQDAAATTPAGTTAAVTTQQVETEPVTAPATQVPAARLTMPDGSEMLLAGAARSFGRRDFEKFLPPDKQTYISRQHFDITYQDGKYYIEDRASTNGTRVNDFEIKGAGKRVLEENDVIEIATKLRMIFQNK